MKHHKSILVTAPSGAGKTTLTKKLLEEFNFLEFSISATTREKRPNEVDGVDYYYITKEEFQNKIKQNEFIEWEEVYGGSYYGTLKTEIDKIHEHGNTPIFDIDIMGAMNIKKILGQDVLSIFIAPPNMEVLVERLRNRKTETEEKIKTRIHKAHSELKFADFFDTKIVNDDIDKAYSELRSIFVSFMGM